ncbi:MAG: tail fiber protein [Saprospiraceae bacterium]|nr:tail fiber protein [Saprospiraceae bacterium]MCB9323692.1 tail fiber protein [Lewinellaceae bacterium]
MNPFLGQIQAFGCGFAPRGWATCDGQLLSINNYSALFSLLGTTFGGDGRSTFGLPDLRGRSIVHVGSGPGLSPISWGQKAGWETVTLSAANLPLHNHPTVMNLGGTAEESGAGHFLGSSGTLFAEDVAAGSTLNANAITSGQTGGGQGYNNRNPFQGIYVCIALEGIFPSRS